MDNYEDLDIAIEVIETDNALESAKNKHADADLLLIYSKKEQKLRRIYDPLQKKKIENLVRDHPINPVGLVASENPEEEFEKFIDSLYGEKGDTKKTRECIDGDNGLNYYKKALTVGPTGNARQELVHEDYCVIIDKNRGIKRKDGMFVSKIVWGKLYAEGKFDEIEQFMHESGTHVVEAECRDGKIAVEKKPRKCLGGCKDGACVDLCKKLDVADNPDYGPGKWKVVFVGSDFASEDEMISAFEDAVLKGIRNFEPFATYGMGLFSYHYVDEKYSENIRFDLSKNAGIEIIKLADQFAKPCRHNDLLILLMPKIPETLEGFVVELGEKKLGSSGELRTLIHEMGHAFGLGHSFPGVNKFEETSKSCFPLTKDPHVDVPIQCRKDPKSKDKVCFIGCNEDEKQKRVSFSSTMGYRLFVTSTPHFLWIFEKQLEELHDELRKTNDRAKIIQDFWGKKNIDYSKIGLPDSEESLTFLIDLFQHESDYFNMAECEAILGEMGYEETENKCNDLPSILGSKKFKCNENSDCVDLFGDCSYHCERSTGNCIIRENAECTMSGYFKSTNWLIGSPGGVKYRVKNEVAPILGRCSGVGQCIPHEIKECIKNWDCKTDRKWAKDCNSGCNTELECIPTENDCRTFDDRERLTNFGKCGKKDTIHEGKCVRGELECIPDERTSCHLSKGWAPDCSACDNGKCAAKHAETWCRAFKVGYYAGKCGSKKDSGKCVDVGAECHPDDHLGSQALICKEFAGFSPNCLQKCSEQGKCVAKPQGTSCGENEICGSGENEGRCIAAE